MTDEDKLTDPADSQEDLTVPKDVSEQTSGTVRQPVRLGAQEQALAHPSSRNYTKYTIIGVVSVIVALALIVAGVGFGIHARNECVARERAVAAAQAECDRSIDRLTRARAGLAKRINAEGTQVALRLTDGQVADAGTLRTLKKESGDSFRAASCRVADVSVLKRAVRANDGAARAARAQDKRLRAAVSAVEGSKAAKDEADRKAEEARKTGEAAAAAQAAAQQARSRQQSSNAGSRRPYQRGNGSQRRSYTQRRSTSPRYTAPRNRYRTSNPGSQRPSNPAPSRPSAPNRPSAPKNNNGGSKSDNDDMGWTLVNGGHHEWNE